MAQKFLTQQNGIFYEKEALVVSTGPADAGKIVALGNDGRLDPSVLPPGIGADKVTLVAGEDLSAGNFVHVYKDNQGNVKVKKADASLGLEAHGFVLDSVASGENVAVYFEGTNNALSGLTGGITYYLSTGGLVSSTAPTTAGHILQIVGRAVSATSINFEPSVPIVLA